MEEILSHSRFENEAAKKMKKEMEESDAEAFLSEIPVCNAFNHAGRWMAKKSGLMVIGCKKTTQ